MQRNGGSSICKLLKKTARTLKQYDIAAAMKPHTTIRSLPVRNR